MTIAGRIQTWKTIGVMISKNMEIFQGTPADLKAVREAVPDRPLLAGSSTTPGNVESFLDLVEGFIVGQHLKKGEELKIRWICSG